MSAVFNIAAAQQAKAIGKYNQQIAERNAKVKEQEAEIAYMKRLYDKGALNPTAGETTMGRLKMLEKKAQSGEALSADEIAEIKRLSEILFIRRRG